MNAISPEQVRAAWQGHVQPERLLTVIVGGTATPATATPPAAPATAPAGS